MKRLAALLAAVPILAACGASASADESAPEPSSPAVAFLARAAGAAGPLVERPGGVRAADGSAYYAVEGGELLRFDPATGERTRTYDLPGDWRLGGVSASGRWVGLTRPGTEVIVLDAETGELTHELSLSGSFAVETISTNGDFLFLQQNFVDGSYAVRGYDLAANQMIPGSLATKGDTVRMQGLASQTVATPDGRWLLTLYVNTKSNTAFVHALNLVDRIPLCIAMPPCKGCGNDELARWALALGPGGRTLYATNPAAGRVAEIDLASARVVAEAAFAPVAGGETFAEVSRDGARVLFTNGVSVWSYDTRAGRVAELEL